jgi:hypothetical protein
MLKTTRSMMDKMHMKHEASKEKDNDYIEKGNKQEIQKNQADRTTRSRVKAR